MEKIISLLNNTPGVAAWKVRTIEEQTQELYFVGKKLETNRSTDTISKKVTVYIDQDGMRGSSVFSIYDYMTGTELEKKISDSMYAASFAMNPYYDLPMPEESQEADPHSEAVPSDMLMDGNDVLDQLAQAVFAADVIPHGSLNATEFFLHVISEQIQNSNGVDVNTTSYKGDIEIIPSWAENGEEAEVYRMLHFRSSNAGDITRQVHEELQMAGDRFRASGLKEVLDPKEAENLKIIVQDGEAAEILDYFCKDLDYRTCYEKSNIFELGDHVQGDHVTGTVLNMKVVPYYPEAADSRPFDSEGTMLRETELIRDGVAVGRSGSNRYGQYLKIEHPAGNLPVMVVEEGTKSFLEMQQEPYLRCVKFSGIQVDKASGYFGGEVRLGYYYDGQKEIPVTGFSISGDMKKVRGSINYSSDTITLRRYHGPKYLEIPDMTINM